MGGRVGRNFESYICLLPNSVQEKSWKVGDARVNIRTESYKDPSFQSLLGCIVFAGGGEGGGVNLPLAEL